MVAMIDTEQRWRMRRPGYELVGRNVVSWRIIRCSNEQWRAHSYPSVPEPKKSQKFCSIQNTQEIGGPERSRTSDLRFRKPFRSSIYQILVPECCKYVASASLPQIADHINSRPSILLLCPVASG